jgi:hypothetical protein
LVRCNAPEFSTVIGATGRVQPCFFISGPSDAVLAGDTLLADQIESVRADLVGVLNASRMRAQRTAIRSGQSAECKTCVCSMWRDLDVVGNSLLPLSCAL